MKRHYWHRDGGRKKGLKFKQIALGNAVDNQKDMQRNSYSLPELVIAGWESIVSEAKKKNNKMTIVHFFLFGLHQAQSNPPQHSLHG